MYYLRDRPDAFFGGALRLYNVWKGSASKGAPGLVEIEPEDNMLVVFPSSVLHEVLPTFVPSGAWLDSRFTINGWMRW